MHAHFRQRQHQNHPRCHPSFIRVPIQPNRIVAMMNFLLQENVLGRYTNRIDPKSGTMEFTFVDPNVAFDFKMRFA